VRVPSNLKPGQSTFNMTPMIDVVFLLIIFFMVATRFSDLEQNIELELPEVASDSLDRAPPQPRTVVVFADGHVELDSRTVTLDELKGSLAAQQQTDPNTSVVVRGDSRCEFQHIASAMAACRDAGISELGITVRMASSPPTATPR
jgi:biopolymer transport protein ExbD